MAALLSHLIRQNANTVGAQMKTMNKTGEREKKSQKTQQQFSII
jgi:hypothetical protein